MAKRLTLHQGDLFQPLRGRRYDLILANPTPAIVAARALTQTIPIVSFMITNEKELGFVASHARPGGNVTGLLLRVEGMVGKQLELAQQTQRKRSVLQT